MTSSNPHPALRIARLAIAIVALPLAAALLSCGGSTNNASTGAAATSATIAAQVAACEATLPQLQTAGLASNESSLLVDAGPCAYGVPYGSASGTAPSVFIVGSQNIAFTNVTVCVHGTTTCQTIDHVMVDTGSSGLRIMSSVLSSNVALSPLTIAGNPVIECAQFADGYTWGSVRTADVMLGGSANTGETASGVQIQVIGDSSAYNTPAACSATGSAENTVATFGANGIIGVGLFVNDCITEATCYSSLLSSPLYYSCINATSCSPVDTTSTQQVSNPVGSFATDYNGVVVALPAITVATGEQNVYGNMYYGVTTQSNNGLVSGQQVFLADGYGDFFSEVTASSPSVPLTLIDCVNSFIDSGSNGIFIPANEATISTDSYGWFDPTNTLTLTGQITGANVTPSSSTENPSNQTSITFYVANADTTLFPANSGNNTAYNSLGGLNSGSCVSGASGSETPSDSTSGIDWGLPFFYGRNLVIGNEYLGNTLPSGSTAAPLVWGGVTYTGPFWAF